MPVARDTFQLGRMGIWVLSTSIIFPPSYWWIVISAPVSNNACISGSLSFTLVLSLYLVIPAWFFFLLLPKLKKLVCLTRINRCYAFFNFCFVFDCLVYINQCAATMTLKPIIKSAAGVSSNLNILNPDLDKILTL